MAIKVIVAGATGNLGTRIVKELIARGADVTALGRQGSSEDKLQAIRDLGAVVALVDMASPDTVAEVCAGAACLVSAVQGLRDVIVDSQTTLLNAAVAAGVPQFIPSDFCVDFTKLTAGENRNFDLRREFHERLDPAPVAATSIFNGAFADVLNYNLPLLDFDKKTVGYWGDPDWKIDFTTMDNTAAYTAAAALDASTPKALHIASFQVSANDLVKFTKETLKTPFALVRLGSVDDFGAANKRERAAHPEGETDLYASWQQAQYLHSMFSAHNDTLDNARYPGIEWTSIADWMLTAVMKESR